jgi:hypothetical protein
VRIVEKDKVILEKGSMPRCAWCGTFYSPAWVSAYGELYCTTDCWSAAYVNSRKPLNAKTVVFITLVISLCLIVANPLYWWFGVFFLVMSIGWTRSDNRKLKGYREYLYRKDLYSDTYPKLLVCDYCSHLNLPDVLNCQFCDASLRDSQMVEGEIPEWFISKPKTETASIPRRCEHCGAVYVYEQSTDDGYYICQNCARRFKPKATS